MSEFCEQVDKTTDVDRQEDYGNALKRMEAAKEICLALSRIAGREYAQSQYHILTMLAEKLTRAAVNPNKTDTWIDIAGYAKFGYQAAKKHATETH